MQIEMRAITAVQPFEKTPHENGGALDAVAAALKEIGVCP